jgi:hypothetical protein
MKLFGKDRAFHPASLRGTKQSLTVQSRIARLICKVGDCFVPRNDAWKIG